MADSLGRGDKSPRRYANEADHLLDRPRLEGSRDPHELFLERSLPVCLVPSLTGTYDTQTRGLSLALYPPINLSL